MIGSQLERSDEHLPSGVSWLGPLSWAGGESVLCTRHLCYRSRMTPSAARDVSHTVLLRPGLPARLKGDRDLAKGQTEPSATTSRGFRPSSSQQPGSGVAYDGGCRGIWGRDIGLQGCDGMRQHSLLRTPGHMTTPVLPISSSSRDGMIPSPSKPVEGGLRVSCLDFSALGDSCS
jgi:hypothetical protein